MSRHWPRLCTFAPNYGAMERLVGVDFEALASANEMTIRERVVHPLLLDLGYAETEILRDPQLADPYATQGSGSRRHPLTLVPDYLVRVAGRAVLVLDAKAPGKNVLSRPLVQQVYSYASHPEIQASRYALCNGLELAVWQHGDALASPSLHVRLADLPNSWAALMALIGAQAMRATSSTTERPLEPIAEEATSQQGGGGYLDICIPRRFPAERQRAHRHYGVHPYFTRQPYTVVQGHIAHFSRPGDTVLDPFGGTGVTAIEAMMLGRRAIHVDLNPLSTFMVSALAAPLDVQAFTQAQGRIAEEYARLEPHTDAEIGKALKRYPKPKPLPLTRDADVETADQLFSLRQTACLGLLKHLILQEKDESVRIALMLCFSSLLAKINRTFHYSVSGSTGGDSAAFRYYRYRIAKEPAELEPLHFFNLRCRSLLKAKVEMAGHINAATIGRLQVLRGSATALRAIPDASVDYIYTDPPYGTKIPYLDLSAMWEAWLDFETTDEDRALEAIQGGSRHKTFHDYSELMEQSLREMYRVLRPDRWLSLVFAHKDPALWHMLLDAAESCGFEYKGAHVQPVGKESFKKRQKPLTVINGQLVLHFFKGRSPSRKLRAALGGDVESQLIAAIEGAIALNHGATLEQINDTIILRALEGGFLHLLVGQYGDLTPFLADRFDFDETTLRYHLRPNTSFKAHIPLEHRLPYHLRSYLLRENARGHYPTSDEVVLTLIPLLRNGTTPSDQTVLKELQRAAHTHNGGWRLNENTSLF